MIGPGGRLTGRRRWGRSEVVPRMTPYYLRHPRTRLNRINEFAVVTEAVAAGGGLALMPRRAARPHNHRLADRGCGTRPDRSGSVPGPPWPSAHGSRCPHPRQEQCPPSCRRRGPGERGTKQCAHRRPVTVVDGGQRPRRQLPRRPLPLPCGSVLLQRQDQPQRQQQRPLSLAWNTLHRKNSGYLSTQPLADRAEERTAATPRSPRTSTKRGPFGSFRQSSISSDSRSRPSRLSSVRSPRAAVPQCTTVLLGSDRPGEYWTLVVTGPQRGRVWQLRDGCCRGAISCTG